MLLSGDGLPWPPVGLRHRSGNQDARGKHRCCQACLFVYLFVKSNGANKIIRSEAVVQSTNVAVEANGEEEIIEVNKKFSDIFRGDH